MLHLHRLPLVFLLFFVCTLAAFAQTGSIKGSVKDAANQEALIGATVAIQGTTLGAAADVEGNFSLSKVPAGKHTVTVSFVGYTTKTIADVIVEAGKTTLINTLLDGETQLQEVVVVGQRTTNTEVAVITEIKNIEQVAVGISAQQISKSQDRDASQVVRRVPGVSIQDDRFVIIRGLNERYNTVLLNDVITPSTEVDVKSFSFDLIPSSAIDRMLVFKSGGAELPGEFAGGVIKIYTKTIPDGNKLSLSLSTSYRSNTTFRNVTDYQGSSTDWLGFDNGFRQLPGKFPSKSFLQNEGRPSESTINKFKQLPDYFNITNKTAMPDLRASINFSRSMSLGGAELTNITSLNYTFARQFANVNQARYDAYDASTGESTINLKYNDQLYTENARLGAMSNWALIFNAKNKIEFRNLFNQLGVKETNLRTGYNNNDRELSNYAFRYESRSIYSGQLNGTHELSDKTTFKWLGGLGYTYRQEPDSRRFTSSRTINSNDPFQIDVQQTSSPTLQQAARFFSKMNEVVYTGSASVEHRLGSKRYENEDKMQYKLRAGTYIESKQRLFNARWFGLVNPSNVGQEVLTLAPESFFTPENISSSGLYYAEGTNFDDKYTAQNLLAAGYVSAYLPFTERLNATIGFRGEFNEQKLQSRRRGLGDKIKVDNPIFRPLPSINLAYNFSEKTLIRAAYSLSLNRPEFRELAPFTYYDFNFDVSRVGNPELKTPQIQNYDLRLEYYPTEGEIISFAVFYKNFTNPIESRIRYAGSGVSFTVDNAEKAYDIGAELELRKSLKGLTGSAFLNDLSVLLNASLIKSDVTTGFANQEQNRALQGQSPYLINTGIYYNNSQLNLQANVLYNVIGRRIFLVGDKEISPTVYEMPRNVVDLNVIKGVGERWQLKLGIQDLLNQPFRLMQDMDLDQKITSKDKLYQGFNRGTYSTIGVSYQF